MLHRGVYRIALIALLFAAGNVRASAAAANLTGPTRQATVVKALIHIRGAILPDSTQHATSYSTVDRRNNDYHVEFHSWWAHMLMHDSHVSDLFRLDRNTAYKVFYDSHKYYKCRVADCPTLYKLLELLSRPSPEEKEKHVYQPQGTDTCPITPVKHGLTVRRTDETKTINGFKTRLYRADFTSIAEDPEHRRNSNALQIKIWTTPRTAAIKKAQAIHAKLVRRYSSEQEQDNPLAKILSHEVFMSLDTFFGDTSREGRHWHSEVTRKLARIRGYPVSINLDWYVHAHACPPPKPEPHHESIASAFGNPLGALHRAVEHRVEHAVENNIKRRFTPDPDKPVLHYDRTITSIQLKSVPESVFDPPQGFTRKPLPKFWTNREHDTR